MDVARQLLHSVWRRGRYVRRAFGLIGPIHERHVINTMKTRILSGVGVVVFLIVMLLCIYTPVFALFPALLSGIAVFEIERVAQVKNKLLMGVSIAFAALLPVLISAEIALPASLIAIGYCILLLLLMLAQYEITRFEHVAIALFASLAIPLSFSCMLLLRDIYTVYPQSYSKADGLLFVIFGISSAWVTDMCAYFVGSKFGKHKMTPKISPKKSWEGAVGGVAGAVLVNLLVYVIFNAIVEERLLLPYWAVLLITIALAVISMFGDLSASVIKRNYGAKDFGKLIPGHGGVMDRFDSCLFVLPTLYFIVRLAAMLA